MSTPERSKVTDGEPASLKDFASDLALLVRKEIDSAREELAGKAKSAGVGAGMLSASAVCAIFALASLTLLLVAGLALALPVWAAALIATVLWGAATAVFALIGKKKVQDAVPFVPEKTIADVKEDIEWARQGVKSSRK